MLPTRADALPRLLAYPEAVEVELFGHPWFKAGKRPFCIYGNDGHPTLAFATSKEDPATLSEMGPFRPTPYMHQHGWVTYDIPAGEEPDWALVEGLLDAAYRRVALKRMLKALDGA